MAKYLAAAAEVAEAPAFAIEVVGTDLWIGCCSTADEAQELAVELVLHVRN